MQDEKPYPRHIFTSREEVDEALQEGLRRGYFRITGYRNGGPLWDLTEAGADVLLTPAEAAEWRSRRHAG